jgi:COMPASS component SWD3
METNRVLELEKSVTESDAEIFSIRWSPDDSHIAAGCSDGTVKVYSAISGALIRSMNCKMTADVYPVTSIRWRPDRASSKTKNVLLAITCDGGLLHWHTSSGKVLHTLRISETQALCSDYNHDGTMFAIGCQDRSIKIFDEGTKEKVFDLSGGHTLQLGHDNRIISIKWVNNSVLMSGGWDNNILIWDIRTSQVVRTFYGPRVYGDSLDIKGDIILAGSYNIEDQLQMWSLSDGRCLFSENLISEGKSCMAYAAQFSKSDYGNVFAVGGMGINQCYFYDTELRKPFAIISNIPKAVYSLDFAYGSDRVAVGSGDGSMKVFRYFDSSLEIFE